MIVVFFANVASALQIKFSVEIVYKNLQLPSLFSSISYYMLSVVYSHKLCIWVDLISNFYNTQ